MNILLAGATGTIGKELLQILGQRRISGVRALVRDAEKANLVTAHGVKAVFGTFEDRPTLNAALSRVETVVLITPASPLAEEQATNVIETAKSAGARRIVRVSAIKADPEGPTNNTRSHGRTEAEIIASGLEYVFLRPNLFMQNLFMVTDFIRQTGEFSFAMANGKMGMVDTRDIASCAAACALSDQWDGQSFELTGPRAISYADVAVVLSKLVGKPVEYTPMSPEDMYAMIESAGWGDWMAALARDYGKAYASGWGDFTTKNVEKITGKSPRDFHDFANEILLPELE